NDADYIIFLRLVRRLIKPASEILAWCIMPNHFHLMVYTTEKSCEKKQQGGIQIEFLTNNIRKLLSGYARIYNKKYNQTGSVFRQKTKAKNLNETEAKKNNYNLSDYIYNCFCYIHQNPVDAGLVTAPGNWKYASYSDYAGNRNGTLCNKKKL